MKRLVRRVLCCVLLLVVAMPSVAEDKEPPAPLDPIRQQDRSTLLLPAEEYRLIPNPEGGLLLLCGDRLAWLEDDGVTLVRERKLPKHYIDLAPRDDYFVAVSQHDGTIELLDATTFEAHSTITLNTKELYRVVPHPTRPISFITIDNGRNPFAMYDERTGDLRSDNDWLGQDLLIDPTGTFMIGGHIRYVKTGEELLRSGNSIITSPRYEAVKTMFRYHFGADGQPVLAGTLEHIPGGYRGLVASPDVRRVSVLAYGLASVGGIDALDFQKLPTAYSVKPDGQSTSLDYHPILPMVGSAGLGGGVFFHSETGQAEKNRFAEPKALDAELAYDKLHFSPDGRHALLLYKVEDKDAEGNKQSPTTRVLVAAPLHLSADEQARVARGPAEPRPVILPELAEKPKDDNKVNLHADMQQATMEWIKANSIFGPESRLSADVIRSSSAFLDEGRGFWMLLEGGLTKSGKTTVIAVHQGKFMTAELTDEQAKASGVEEMTLVKTPGQVFENQEAPRWLLRIESASQEASTDGKIKGKAVLTKLGDRSNARFAMMYTTVHDGKIKTSIHHMTNWITDERSERTFSFKNPVEDDKPTLVIGFLQIESFDVSRQTLDLRTKLSDPALFITIQRPKKPAE